jgi:hypothetical protein
MGRDSGARNETRLSNKFLPLLKYIFIADNNLNKAPYLNWS